MINPQHIDDEEEQAAGSEPVQNEAMLRAEIGFWQELISSSGEEEPETLERMRQALAFAECRLASLFEAYRRAAENRQPRPSNVYYLEKSRRTR